VEEAQDGEQALTMIQEQPPDLVLMDLHLPRRDGYGVLQEIRGNPKLASLPVVAVTANAMPGDQDRVLAAGFTGYIAKPVALSQLREEVNRLLRPK
jgi:CheY-like chemotaxis protein